MSSYVESRDDWDAALTEQVAAYTPDLVVSAGFLKLVGKAFLGGVRGRFVNTHNALLPSFPGIHGPRDALAHGVKITGATLFVVDEGVDTGAIVAQVAVPVEDGDDEETLDRAHQGGRARDAGRTGRPDGARRLHHRGQEGHDPMSAERAGGRSGGP